MKGINQQALKVEGLVVSAGYFRVDGRPTLLKKCQCSITCLGIRKIVGLTAENNREQKKKESVPNDDDMLQPVNKVDSKLDKELQDWEVDSTQAGD
ncbi:MAG: hypothetical protein M3115_07020 [Thermoproteota archaeon]|nr:hypothetical protein [Thermoproteota archaeon]